MKYFKSLLSILSLILLSNYGNAQHRKLDSLLITDIPSMIKAGNYNRALQLSMMVRRECSARNYIKGSAWANYQIANILTSKEEFAEALQYLKRSENENKKIKDPALDAAINIGYGRLLNEQKISHTLAIEKFKTAVIKSKGIKDKKSRKNWTLFAYKNLFSAYTYLNATDSAYSYALAVKKLNTGYDLYNLLSIAFYHANYSKKQDSLVYYLNKGNHIASKTEGLLFEKAIVHNLWGDYYLSNDNLTLAKNNYRKAEYYSLKSSCSYELLKSYEKLEIIYRGLNNDSASTYRKKATVLREKTSSKILNNVDKTISHVINNKNNEDKKKHDVIIIIIILTTVALTFVYNNYKNNIKLFTFNRRLIDQQKLIDCKEYSSDSENSSIEVSFEELCTLAEKNSPLFFNRFETAYPQFRKKLYDINPNLKHSELVFSAYIAMGYQTKDIALYTFKSVKTIQNKKNRIRKRLNINSDEDLTSWFLENLRNN